MRVQYLRLTGIQFRHRHLQYKYLGAYTIFKNPYAAVPYNLVLYMSTGVSLKRRLISWCQQPCSERVSCQKLSSLIVKDVPRCKSENTESPVELEGWPGVRGGGGEGLLYLSLLCIDIIFMRIRIRLSRLVRIPDPDPAIKFCLIEGYLFYL